MLFLRFTCNHLPLQFQTTLKKSTSPKNVNYQTHVLIRIHLITYTYSQKPNFFQVILCVCYCLTYKVTHQFTLNGRNIFEAINSPQVEAANALERTDTDEELLPKLANSSEEVRSFFFYTFKPEHVKFYKWYKKILVDFDGRKRRFGEGLNITVTNVNWDDLKKITPWPIPEREQTYYIVMNEWERLANESWRAGSTVPTQKLHFK